jgi:hypothetical protein
MKRILLALATLLLAAPLAMAILTTDVNVSWDPPGYFMMGMDCADTSAPIGTAIGEVQYEVRWTSGGGTEQVAVTSASAFTIQATAGQLLNVKVGAFLPGGTVACWSEASLQVPVPTPGSCGTIKLEIH